MRSSIKISILILLFLVGCNALSSSENLPSTTMNISSPVFTDQHAIPALYTCSGNDINPPLSFGNIPANTKSLVLILDDPDAPAGTWVHWTLWNMQADLVGIEENSVPENSIEGLTSFGRTGYGGPCPPSGVHRYYFKLYALDTLLELSSSSDVNDLVRAMEGHVLEEAHLMGTFTRDVLAN